MALIIFFTSTSMFFAYTILMMIEQKTGNVFFHNVRTELDNKLIRIIDKVNIRAQLIFDTYNYFEDRVDDTILEPTKRPVIRAKDVLSEMHTGEKNIKGVRKSDVSNYWKRVAKAIKNSK